MIVESVRWAATWAGVLVLLSVVVFPLAYRLLPGLPGRGVAFCPPLGLLVVSYLSWLAASVHLVPFGAPSLWGAVAVVAALSVLSEVQTRGAAIGWLRHNGRVALWFLLVFAAAFVLFAWVRGFRPEVRATEKPMEIGFLASTMRAVWMPPTDQWFAGGTINYYYFGYVQAAAMAHLAGVNAGIAFNLTNIMLFAMAFTAACGIAYDLLARGRRERGARSRSPLLPSLVGGLLLVVAGNAFALLRLLQDPATTIGQYFYEGVGWNSTRVIKDVFGPTNIFPQITEFPAFSFILGDNHPHVLALPTVLLTVAVAFGWWWKPLGGWRDGVPRLALTALVIGVLYPLNAWDVPTFGLLVVLAMLLRRPALWQRTLGAVAGVAAGAYLLFLPFHRGYISPLGGSYGGEPAAIAPLTAVPILGKLIRTIGLVVWPHTELGQFLVVFVLPFVVCGCLVGRGIAGRGVPLSPQARQRLLVAGVVVALLAIMTRTPMLFPTGLLVGGAIVALVRPVTRPNRAAVASPWAVWTGTDRAATALVLLGAALPVSCEFVYLRDAFDNRLNTMFKLDFQSWALLMIAGAYGVLTLLSTVQRAATAWQPDLRRFRLAATGAAVAVFVAFAVAYPLLTAYARTGHWGQTGEFGGPPEGWQGLDGYAYAIASNPDEYAALRWLEANAGTNDAIVEGVGNSYGETGGWFDDHYSALSGVPTVLGWYYHEVQWRGGDDRVRQITLPERRNDVSRLYTTTNMTEARALLQKYGVRWVIVGNAEKLMYGDCQAISQCDAKPAPGLAKFRQMLVPMYDAGGVTIYRVPPDGG